MSASIRMCEQLDDTSSCIIIFQLDGSEDKKEQMNDDLLKTFLH